MKGNKVRLKSSQKKALALIFAVAFVVTAVTASWKGSEAANTGRYEYQYAATDPLYAATHFHLFARNEVSATAHTCGNIACRVFSGGTQYGSRAGQNDKEISYIQKDILEMDGSTDIRAGLYLGSPFVVSPMGEHQTRLDSPSRSGMILNHNESKLYVEEAGSKLIDIDAEFTKLEALSKSLAKKPSSSSVVFDLNDMNNKNIDFSAADVASGVVAVKVPMDKWLENENKVDLVWPDTNTAHTGFVVLNFDLKDYDGAVQLGRQMEAYETQAKRASDQKITSNCTEKNSDEYGKVRILYNFYDSSKPDYVYRGHLVFSREIYGCVLAPGANIIVGQLNGTVVANNIKHEGNESHRCDLVAEGASNKVKEKDDVAPTPIPTVKPTSAPTAKPTVKPTVKPTSAPTAKPTVKPTVKPSEAPASTPTAVPSEAPASTPTAVPSKAPASTPTVAPSKAPASTPTVAPSKAPASTPTVAPSKAPAGKPTAVPSKAPASTPTVAPSKAPAGKPTAVPSKAPAGNATAVPSKAPTSTVEVTNTKYTGTGNLVVTVRDKNTDEVIPDAKVELRDSEGGTVTTVVTNSEGKVTITDLKEGTYEIDVTEVPKGYSAPDKVSVDVVENQTTNEVVKVGNSSDNDDSDDEDDADADDDEDDSMTESDSDGSGSGSGSSSSSSKKQTATSGGEIVSTGDQTPIHIPITVMAVSLVVFVLVLCVKRKVDNK